MFYSQNWNFTGRSLAKKNQYPTIAFVYYPNGNEMDQIVLAYRSTELLFSTHTFNFNCFFDDFNRVFTHIRCLSRLLDILSKQFKLGHFRET